VIRRAVIDRLEDVRRKFVELVHAPDSCSRVRRLATAPGIGRSHANDHEFSAGFRTRRQSALPGHGSINDLKEGKVHRFRRLPLPIRRRSRLPRRRPGATRLPEIHPPTQATPLMFGPAQPRRPRNLPRSAESLGWCDRPVAPGEGRRCRCPVRLAGGRRS
jgi:transposase